MPAPTKLKIAEAALETLKQRGFAGASAREIAGVGGFNQALIFYHYGSVQKALLAALELVSARRMNAYRPRLSVRGRCPNWQRGPPIYAEDLENGYVTVLGEMVAGGVCDAELGGEVAARLQPWIDMVADKLRELVAGSPFESMLPRATWRSRSSRCTWALTCSATWKADTPARSRCSTSASATRRCSRRWCLPSGRRIDHSADTGLDLVTGAFSYTGSRIAARLLDSGREVRTLTFHPDRPHPLQGRVDVPSGSTTRWLSPRAWRGSAPSTTPIGFASTTGARPSPTRSPTRARSSAQPRAGVARIVHVSIANPSLESTLPYYRGKALVELALAEVGVPYSIVRPTWYSAAIATCS